jgi:hypothetical protein
MVWDLTWWFTPPKHKSSKRRVAVDPYEDEPSEHVRASEEERERRTDEGEMCLFREIGKLKGGVLSGIKFVEKVSMLSRYLVEVTKPTDDDDDEEEDEKTAKRKRLNPGYRVAVICPGEKERLALMTFIRREVDKQYGKTADYVTTAIKTLISFKHGSSIQFYISKYGTTDIGFSKSLNEGVDLVMIDTNCLHHRNVGDTVFSKEYAELEHKYRVTAYILYCITSPRAQVEEVYQSDYKNITRGTRWAAKMLNGLKVIIVVIIILFVFAVLFGPKKK